MLTNHANPSETLIVRRVYQTLRPPLLSEQAFRASVFAIETRQVRYMRALHRIERRTIKQRSAPSYTRERAQLAPTHAPVPDPWTADPEQLPKLTRQLGPCPECDACARASCATCGGFTGQIYSWLEVERAERMEVRAAEDELATHLHPELLARDDFERDTFLHRLERDEFLSPERFGELPEALRPSLQAHDRVTEVRLQSFVADLHEVHYRTALGAGVVEVAGSPLTIFRATRAPFTRRSLVACSAALATGVASALGTFSYRQQHPWFAKYGPSSAALLLGLCASALLWLALLGWLRARRARTLVSTALPSLGAAGVIALGALLLSSGRPSLAGARAALAQRDLERALLTADALHELGLPFAQSETLRDDIRLARMETAATLGAALEVAKSEPWSEARLPAMRSTLLTKLEPQAEHARASLDGSKLAQLSKLIAPLSPGDSHALAVQAAALATRSLLARGELERAEHSLLELGRLGAGELRERGRQDLIALVRARLSGALAAVSRARSSEVALERLHEADALCDTLERLGANVPRSLRAVVERGTARAERRKRAVDRLLAPRGRQRARDELRVSRDEQRERLLARAPPAADAGQ